METKSKMDRLLKLFNFNYDRIYRTETPPNEYHNLVLNFNDFITTNKSLVLEFNKVRNDVISSDREAAAFMLAMRQMNEKAFA